MREVFTRRRAVRAQRQIGEQRKRVARRDVRRLTGNQLDAPEQMQPHAHDALAMARWIRNGPDTRVREAGAEDTVCASHPPPGGSKACRARKT
jgi:hypothetical protein